MPEVIRLTAAGKRKIDWTIIVNRIGWFIMGLVAGTIIGSFSPI